MGGIKSACKNAMQSENRMSCPNSRSSSQRYTYLLIFFGIVAIINYWYLILRFWWAFLIIGIIVKLIVDDSNKGKQKVTNTKQDPTITVLKPVNVTERISMIVAAYRVCFSCGQGFPIADQFQHQNCPACNEIHYLSNNIKLMHYKMIERILNNCHKCNLGVNFQDQFCSDCGTAVDHELQLINALEQKKIANKYKWINNLQ